MTADRRVFSFKDSEALDPILERVLRERPAEFSDKSDFLRKSCHLCLRTLGYELPEKAVNAQAPKAEEESVISEVFAVDARK